MSLKKQIKYVRDVHHILSLTILLMNYTDKKK